MFIVLVLAGIFVVGLVTLAVCLWRMLTSRWAAEQTPRVEPGVPYVSPRSKELTLLEREIRQAAADGKLTAPTELELLSHLQAERRTLGERGAAGKAEAMPRKEERDHPIPESIPSSAEPAVPAPEAFKPQVVPEAPPRDVRAAIARLHHDAEEAKALAGTPAPPRERTEVTPEPGAVPLAPPPRVELPKKAAAPLPPPKPKIPWTVRLFTPENVRILQSLGIAIVFFSAVAYVRTSMWEAASTFSRMSLLLCGTAACLAMGYALRRWTFLRLTGLAFVLLGHLAFALDAYAALLGSGPGQLPLWPFAPSALWCLTLSVFALSSAWHARKLDEPLFNAFALFGGLGAWGMALRWMNVPWTLLPAVFVPVLFALLLATRFLAERGAAARWSLRWWCEVAWRDGARLGVLLLPVAACLSPQAELARHLPWHLAALGLVSGGLAWPRRGEEGAGDAAWACLGVAFMTPLAAWALRWSAEWWTAAVALPGAVMAWSGLLAGAFAPVALRRRWEAARDAGLCLLGVGLALGFGWSIRADPTPLLLSVAAAWTVAWGCVWRQRGGIAPWAAALLGAWGFKLLAQVCGWGPETWALGWLLLASLPLVLWNRLPEQDARARHGATSSDALALLAALWLSLALQGSIGSASALWSLGWLACAGYAALTARLSRSAWRVGVAVALLSPTLASLHVFAGSSGHGHTWTYSLLAAAAALGSRRLARSLLDAESAWPAALAGACVPLLHAAVLALAASAAGAYASAAWAWGGVGLACGAFAWRLRREEAHLELAETFEFLALLGLNAAGASLALQVWGELAWRPAVFLALTAATTFLALWGEYLGADVRREQPAYRRAGASVSLLLTGAALLLVAADWPQAGASRLWASPIGLGWAGWWR